MNYSEQSLRTFGLMVAGLFAGIFGLLLPFIAHKHTPIWPFALAGIILLPSIFKPIALKGAYVVWMKLGNGLGWINTRIILSAIFYLLITPMGVILRLFGYNALQPKFDKSATSYFHQVNPKDKNHMERPF